MASIVALMTLSTALYCVSASLPFTVTKTYQLLLAPAIGVLTAICWVYISRMVPSGHIPYYGLVYDVLLTLAFFIVPFWHTTVSFNGYNLCGLLLLLAGLGLLKL